MTKNKRYTIKSQDDYFAITDNYSFDKVCIINHIRTKLEAEWLCGEINELNDECEELKQENQSIQRKVFKLMDWLETEKGVSRDEIMGWWND